MKSKYYVPRTTTVQLSFKSILCASEGVSDLNNGNLQEQATLVAARKLYL